MSQTKENHLFEIHCAICRHLREDSPYKIAEYTDSILFLNEDQFFKGYCILEYKEHIKELFDLTNKERELLMGHVCQTAKALQKAFLPDKINYELLGNKVPHLHWHIIPRFKGDSAWSDPVWSRPHLPEKIPVEQVNQLISEIQRFL